MWSYQTHFRTAADGSAKSIFRRLSERLSPAVILIGVWNGPTDPPHSVRVESPKGHWLRPDDLTEILAKADEFCRTAKDSPESHFVAQSHANPTNAGRLQSIRKATAFVIDNARSKPVSKVYFVGWPVMVGDYLVMVVLELDRDDFTAYPRLASHQYWLHQNRSYKLPRSLIDAVVEAFLDESTEELHKPNPGSNLLSGSTQHTLEAAARHMVCGLAMRCDSGENTFQAEQEIFDRLVEAAALGYERSPSRGRILLARKNHPAVRTRLTFRNPVELTNSRAVRKLLEITKNNTFCLHTNSSVIWGIVELDRSCMEPTDETLFEIEFLDSFLWECRLGGRVLLQIDNGVPRLSGRSIHRDALQADLFQLFPLLSERIANEFVDVIEAAAQQVHGALVVISSAAATEAHRLSRQSTPIESIKIDSEMVQAASAIDGAILLGVDGCCHAIGVILDGLSNDMGNPARGARYNSAVRYVYSRPEPCLAFVVSEDGGVDVIIK